MTATATDIPVIPSPYRTPLFVACIAAGLVGNYFKFQLFLNIEVLFGSIFAMLALQFFGPCRGTLAAAIIAGYTYVLWNHPYAFVIMTLEVAAVGWLMHRRDIGIVLADIVFWLCVGMPLIYLFYQGAMQASLSNTCITMIKQALNGIVNALLARLIFSAVALRLRSPLLSFREVIYNLLAFFVLCPALLMLGISSRTDFAETDRRIRETMLQSSRRETEMLETWVRSRKDTMLMLAEKAATTPPAQMQSFLELTERADVNITRVGLLNREATTIAYFPLRDELGQRTVGTNFADRPFIPLLKQTLKPMLSEVVMSRIGVPKPTVLMLAPVVTHGEYAGFVSGGLNLEQLRGALDRSAFESGGFYTLLDKRGSVILTNRREQKVMTPFNRPQGVFERDAQGLVQWVPTARPNMPVSERWKESLYIAESAIGDLAEWKLVLEQPVAPFQKQLYDSYSAKLALLFMILLGSMGLAALLSRKVVGTLEQLCTLTFELPLRLVTGDKHIVWPASGIKEETRLIDNFREMTDSLTDRFEEITRINETLEQRVEERTEASRKSAANLSATLNATADGILAVGDKGKVLFFNEQFATLWNVPQSELGVMEDSVLLGKVLEQLSEPEKFMQLVKRSNCSDKSSFDTIVFTDGRVLESYSLPLRQAQPGLADQSRSGRVWSFRDITRRQQADAELRQSKEEAETANRIKSRFLSIVAHEFNTPLGLLVVSTDILSSYWERLSAEERRQQLGQIRNAAIQMTHLVDTVIAFNCPQNSAPPKESLPLDISIFCHNIADEMLAVWGRGHRFTRAIADDCGRLMLDEVQFRRVLSNLLSNAFRFTPAGGAVILTVSRKPDSLVVTVADSGIGIPQEEQNSIFEGFYRCSNVDARSGLGLGLSIVSDALKQLGGHISVTSRPGEGATFRVELPASNAFCPGGKQP